MEKDSIFDRIPKDLARDLEKLEELNADGWSEEWKEVATCVIFRINALRDSSEISMEDYNHIRRDFLKSYGILDGENLEFINFWLNSVNKE